MYSDLGLIFFNWVEWPNIKGMVLKGVFFDRKRSQLCGGYALLSRHELCRIYSLFWSGFDADFYADIEDFVQILCRFLHKKMLVGSSVLKSWFES